MRLGEPPMDAAPVVVRDEPKLRVTAVPVGWVAVRRAHREYGGPWALRMPSIALDRRWAAWMPVNVTLIEHATGVILVDTGEAIEQPPGHFGCGDPVQERIYRSYLRMPVRRGFDAPSRLRALGVQAGDVDIIVLTHLHGDHTGNLPAFPRAQVLAGPGEKQGYPGAITCRLTDRELVVPRFTDGRIDRFATSLSLTGNGLVRAVPLPGHTPGHLGVVIAGSITTVAAGDVALDYDQLSRGGTPGIAADRTANRTTQTALREVLDAGGQVLLSHDRPRTT